MIYYHKATHSSWACQRGLAGCCWTAPWQESQSWRVPACWECPLEGCRVSVLLLCWRGPAAPAAPRGLRCYCPWRGCWECTVRAPGALSHPRRRGRARPTSCVWQSSGCALGPATSWWSENSRPPARTEPGGRRPVAPWNAYNGVSRYCPEGRGPPSWTAESGSPEADSSHRNDLEHTDAHAVHPSSQTKDFRQQRVSRSKKKKGKKKGRQLQKINTNYLKWKQAI